MVAPPRGKRFLFALALVVFSTTTVQSAVGPENVLVLYNNASADGVALANYYAEVHPGVHLLGIDLPDINGMPPGEAVTAEYYLKNIRQSILDSGLLNSQSISINTIVTTKGLPLRIYNNVARPATYTDPFGVSRKTAFGWWSNYSSLESELTRIDPIGAGYNLNDPSTLNTALLQMADQKYYIEGSSSYPQPSNNPYYLSTSYFNYDDYSHPGYGGMRLSARLDGYTASDVITAIDKAQQAYLLPIANSKYIVADNDPIGKDGSRLLMQNLQDNLLAPNQTPYFTGDYNNTNIAITSESATVIGYVSHGVHGSELGPQYILPKVDPNDTTKHLSFTLANGAVFETHESYNAYSFQTSGNTRGMGQVAQWLAIGGTAGVGNVEEPSSGAQYEVNEEQMFRMLLDGKTWGEAAWSSLQMLSYVNTVVGDPLMTWKQVLLGDADLDGLVGSSDLAILADNWGHTGQSGGYIWSQGDFNADGLIGSADLAILADHWGSIANWASGSPLSGSIDTQAFLASMNSIPEPSTTTIILSGLIVFMLTYRYRRYY